MLSWRLLSILRLWQYSQLILHNHLCLNFYTSTHRILSYNTTLQWVCLTYNRTTKVRISTTALQHLWSHLLHIFDRSVSQLEHYMSLCLNHTTALWWVCVSTTHTTGLCLNSRYTTGAYLVYKSVSKRALPGTRYRGSVSQLLVQHDITTGP